ncbi:mucin-2-like [Dendropsophus ebraccatus]|uniref:mucin-2-like n=1 Tax=Dendropsophus ebraccatus TaxID=150705 RepID=UPI003831A581
MAGQYWQYHNFTTKIVCPLDTTLANGSAILPVKFWHYQNVDEDILEDLQQTVIHIFSLTVWTTVQITCFEGLWKCTSKPCSGSCAVEGGSHIRTFDQRKYNFHGRCSYVLTQLCTISLFAVHAHLKPCDVNEFETCLSKIMLIIKKPKSIPEKGSQPQKGSLTGISDDLELLHNDILPFEGMEDATVQRDWVTLNTRTSTRNLTIFKPTTFYIIVNTSIGLRLEIQLVPIMQVYLYLQRSYFGRTCGLCGNYNDKQLDDYIIPNGMVVQDLGTFSNSWKNDQTCPKASTDVIDPCSINIQKDSYASLWCSKLNAKDEPFAVCHPFVNPFAYLLKCLYDSCLCKNSENCMCAAVSSYVRACSERGVIIKDWRNKMCNKYIKNCQISSTYQSDVNKCPLTCQSLSVPDRSCSVNFTPIDGCVCKKGLYLTQQDCTPPMIFFNCSRAPEDAKGIECLKSCQSLNVDCYSDECVSGCICPDNMLADGKGGCVFDDSCTCFYNDKIYDHKAKAKIGCNTCTCDNRKWDCEDETSMAECLVYGDGNYITFDKRHYRYSGQCEYTLVQDFCGNSMKNGTFRIISENTKCSDTGSTCSKNIKVYLDDYILQLENEKAEISVHGEADESPFQIQNTSLYLIINIRNGLVLIWNKKTGLRINAPADFQHNVCGLCGNYDGNSNNDFNTRGHCTVEDVIEFGNSWKLLPSCPETEVMIEPCESSPHRKPWAQRQCSIILSDSFKPCHSEVDPTSYYDACVKDSCACDEGGDCDCYCTAIAMYAQQCLAHCICIDWRTPHRCPVFCDYYNEKGKCEWHYKSCGSSCLKTCRNPSGNCSSEPVKVEGCYPQCPNDKPFFEEISMECVSECGCYDQAGYYYKPGEKVVSCNNCEICNCTTDGIKCEYNVRGKLSEKHMQNYWGDTIMCFSTSPAIVNTMDTFMPTTKLSIVKMLEMEYALSGYVVPMVQQLNTVLFAHLQQPEQLAQPLQKELLSQDQEQQFVFVTLTTEHMAQDHKLLVYKVHTSF